MSLLPGARLGPYEILSAIGAGGMGEVYRARDTNLDREVAIKVLPDAVVADPDRVARFQREAKTIASLNHPNIAVVHGLEDAPSTSSGRAIRALVMELVEGPTLADRIAAGPLPLEEARVIARQIAEALQAAHDQGIIHRDLKPANIKLRPDGTVKVLDFGLAKTSGAGAASGVNDVGLGALNSPTLTSPAMTAAGVILGTAAYMSPEQAKGRGVDKRADIWAFGCVLFEMLTGRRPFDGDDVSDLLATVLKSDPDWAIVPPHVPAPMQSLIRRCLEKDLRKRVADIAVARFVLEETLTASSGTTPAAVVDSKRRTLKRAAVVLAGALVVVTSAWIARAIDRAPSPLPIHFEIVPPAAEPFAMTGNDRDLVVSPDGRAIVYRVTIGGSSHLAVRTFDRLEGRVLEGTDGARSPIMSSDGQWVAFQAFGQLKKVNLSGGAPTTLCQTNATLRGGTWHGDTIVFATSDANTGLFSVAAAGGEATVVTTPETAAGEADHLFPAFLPDGRRLLFAAMPVTGGGPNIAVLDLTTKERKVVVRGGSYPQYAPPDVLLFVAAGTLRAARFDPARAEIVSDPIPVIEQVSAVPSGAANVAVSPNGTLVYVPGGPINIRRALVWVERDGREQVLPGEQRSFVDPRLSPDGQRIVVELNDESDDIWILDVTRGALTRLTFEPGEDETPVWMPDGASLVYASSRAETPRAIFRRRADGTGGEEPLWKGRDHVHVEAVTPDGRALFISSAQANGAQQDLMLLPLHGDRAMKPLIQTRFSERNPQMSPDGRWLAYVSDESGRDEVYVRAYPSLEGKTQVSTAGGARPAWSKRGDALFFLSGRQYMTAGVKSGTPLAVSTPRPLFANTYFTKGGGHIPYDVARDGRLLMVKDMPTQTATDTRASLIVVLHWLEELKARLK